MRHALFGKMTSRVDPIVSARRILVFVRVLFEECILDVNYFKFIVHKRFMFDDILIKKKLSVLMTHISQCLHQSVGCRSQQ